MNDVTSFAPSLQLQDFLTAFDLDRINIQEINIYHDQGIIIIYIVLNTKVHTCPLCNTPTSKVKSYHLKKINHSVLNPTPCTIHYKARRLICPMCGKTFYESNPFVLTNSKVSVATVYNVLSELKRPEATFSYIGHKYHMSPSSVSNIFDKHIDIPRRPLPTCLCFDETYAFKSDTSDYICVLLDYMDKKVVDVLPSRRKRALIDYFFNIPLQERKNVKYVSFDMWATYREVAKLMFPNCVTIVDKFHVLQELSRRVTRVRIDVMNKQKQRKDVLEAQEKELKKQKLLISPQLQQELRVAQVHYYLLKKFNFVLFSNNPTIVDPTVEKKYNRFLQRYCNLYDIYDLIINIDDGLKEAVEIRDEIHLFYKDTTYEHAKEEVENIIIRCRTSSLKSMQEFANTLTQWKPEIIHSFIIIPGINKKMNNALIENRNKSIKLIKHSSNGYTNWPRFRNRVLFCLNDDIPIKI